MSESVVAFLCFLGGSVRKVFLGCVAGLRLCARSCKLALALRSAWLNVVGGYVSGGVKVYAALLCTSQDASSSPAASFRPPPVVFVFSVGLYAAAQGCRVNGAGGVGVSVFACSSFPSCALC